VPYEIEHTTVELPLDTIAVGRNIKNIRTVFNDDSTVELAKSIFHDGLLNPLVVMPTTDPESGEAIIELVCGARRMRAISWIRENLDPDWSAGEVRCTQFAGTLEDAKLLNGVENVERENVDEVDTCAWLYHMVEEEGRTQDDLAERMHRSGQWVSLRLTVHRKGSDELKQALREGLISISAAYELAKNLSKEDQDKRVKRARTNAEKLITLEEATTAGDPDRVPRPSKKKIAEMLAKAEQASANLKKRNAHGTAMGLRYVLGLCSEDEATRAIEFEPEEEPSGGNERTDDAEDSKEE